MYRLTANLAVKLGQNMYERKQKKVLRCVYIILNIYTNKTVEYKMARQLVYQHTFAI